VQTITVSRDDSVYECFADVAQAGGILVCTYRESMEHRPVPFSRVVVRRSEDGGYTWRPKQILIEKNAEAGEGGLNCSRILGCSDGTLLLVVDFLPAHRRVGDGGPSVPFPVQNLLFRSSDAGRTWHGPEETGISDGIVPSIKELSNGDLLIGVTKQERVVRDGSGHLREDQIVYRSSDGGKSWEGPAVVPSRPELDLNEGDFVELDDGTIVLYMREDTEGLTGWKSVSTDGGRTWGEPFRSQMYSCQGRPSAGRLRSGEIVVTYRFRSGISRCLALYVESAEQAVSPEPVRSNEYMADYYQNRFGFIDIDRGVSADSGYSGWVQLSNGDLFVVNYITDDAPQAQIRGYIVGREDWFLFPEGAMPWLSAGYTSRQYIDMAADWARDQQAKNVKQDWSHRVPTQK